MRGVEGLGAQLSRHRRRWWLLGCVMSVVACKQQAGSDDAPAHSAAITADAAPSAQASASAPAPSAVALSDAGPADAAAGEAASSKPDPKRYAWIANEALKQPAAVTTLRQRFPPPPSYTRLPVEAGSFGEWLRDLPLAAPNTPVVSHKGEELQAGDAQYLGAVVAMDTSELQTSSDMILRLNAEWKYSKGQDIVFKSATGLELPFARWLQGDRLKANGASVN